ncbi:MAG: V-type ATP synthase subunit E [Clostridia bacterium]|nr:V-type ATP synthase subunit E [Clostridia bacterium]
MHNLAKILEKIEADCLCRMDAVRRDAEEKAARMQRETEERIAVLETEAAGQAEKAVQEMHDRARASAVLQTRELLLAEKTALLTEVYCRAEEALLHLAEDVYIKLFSKLAADAVLERVNTVRFLQEEYRDEAFADEQTTVYTLLFSEDDRERVGEAVLASVRKRMASELRDPPALVLAEETAAISGGVVVRFGDTEAACSIPVILAGLRDRLDPVVLKMLFGE